jgi:hypothetical protein
VNSVSLFWLRFGFGTLMGFYVPHVLVLTNWRDDGTNEVRGGGAE